MYTSPDFPVHLEEEGVVRLLMCPGAGDTGHQVKDQAVFYLHSVVVDNDDDDDDDLVECKKSAPWNESLGGCVPWYNTQMMEPTEDQ